MGTQPLLGLPLLVGFILAACGGSSAPSDRPAEPPGEGAAADGQDPGDDDPGPGDQADPGPGPGPGQPDTVPGGPEPGDGKSLVVYWGQNGFGALNLGDRTKWEKDLGTLCTQNPHYDIVVLGFVISFVRTRNAGPYPELNFSYHCETPYDQQNPFLLRCANIEQGIKTCHAQGKRVLLSLGGAAGAYGFLSDAEGEAFAQTVWDLFLGGTSTVRPFGSAVLDGVDLDIEGGSTVGYTAFVRRLRTLMQGERRYYITAAPQCPSPDAYMGPAAGKPLGDVPQLFDFLFVQFYNNFCHFGNRDFFQASFDQWASLRGQTGPKLFVGLPAMPQAGGGHVAPADLPALISLSRQSPAFGGVMLWDASYDGGSGALGSQYSNAIDALLR